MSIAAGAADIATFGFRADTSGLTAADAALERMAKTAEASATAIERWEARANAAFKKVSPSMLSGAGPAAAAAAASTAGVAAATTAHAGLAAATDKASAATGAHATVLRAGTEAHKAHGAAVGLNTNKLMELQHVGRSVIDVMASGGSMTRAFTLEGGRLFEIFGPGTAKVKEAIAAFQAIPIAARLAGGAVAGAGVAAALAFAEYESGQDRLERSLNGIGRRSGATLGQLQGVAAQGATAGRLSIGEATDLTGRFTAAGLTPDLTGSLVSTTRDYGRVTGQSTGDAGTALAAAMRDPVKGLADLDKNLGFVDDRLQQQVQDLERSGHLHEAQAAAMSALKAAVDGAKDSTWAFTRGLNSAETWLGNKFNQAGAGMAAAFGLNSDADKLAELRSRADNLQRVDPVGNGDYISEIRRQMVPLMASVQADELKAAADKRDADATALSRQAGDAVRSILPDITRARSAADTLDVLRQAMGDPLIRQHMSPDEGRLVSRAYGQAGVVSDMARPGLRQRQDYDLRMAAIDDSGTQDQGLNAARKAELAVLRETGDVVRAATAAQQSYNETIAKANSDAEERLRQAQLDSKLIGLSPYERAMQQLKNEYEGPRGILERDRVDSTSVLDDADIKRDLTGAAKWTASISSFTTALDGASQRLAAFPGAASGPYGAGPRPMADTPYTGPVGAVSNHQRQMAQMLVEAGYPQAGAIGFVGGLTGESGAGLNPMARNASNHRGIAQWDSARYGAMAATGDPNDFATQARFIIKELGGPESIAAAHLRAATSVRDGLAANFSYERPSNAEIASSYGSRLAAGNALAGTYGASPAGVDHSTMTVHAASPAFAAPALGGPAPIASMAYGFDKSTYAQKQADVTKSFGDVPIDQANKLLTTQGALLATNRDSFGQSAAAIRGAAEAQALWNRLALDGIVPVGELSKATGGLSDKVRDYGTAAAKVAQQQDDQQRQQRSAIDTADTLRGGFDGVLSGGLLSAAHGKGFGAGASSALSGFGDTLLHKGMSSITGSLFGGQGSGFGGLLGGLFSGHMFAGGTSDAPAGPAIVGEKGPELVNLPAHAQVMTNGQTQGWMASRPSGHTFNVGGPIINVAGDVSEQNRAEIQRAVAAGQQQTVEHITRNLPQIQRDAGQAG